MSASGFSAGNLSSWVSQIVRPDPFSRKGQNGKAMIIGGSELFHAASQWSFVAASRWVDMLFYSSVVENNELIQQSKINFSDGVVVPRSEVTNYLREVAAVLIGPGMRRDVVTRFSPQQMLSLTPEQLQESDWESDTLAVSVALMRAFPEKKWIIDAGALQVLPLSALPHESILTPHAGEFEDLLIRWEDPGEAQKIQAALSVVRQKIQDAAKSGEGESLPAQCWELESDQEPVSLLRHLAQRWNNATIVLKGSIDVVVTSEKVVAISGGNAGLTKGGTGDILAGLVLGLATTSRNDSSCVVASLLLKQAAHDLFQTQREMFNASDVAARIPQTFGAAFAADTSSSSHQDTSGIL